MAQLQEFKNEFSNLVERVEYTPELRYERKFQIENSHLENVLLEIKNHPAFFREIFQERRVNNIYFDTENYSCYDENVIGIGGRIKIRMRWYGSSLLNIVNPVLEFKLKSGLVGDKIRVKMASFYLEEQTPAGLVSFLIHKNHLPVVIRESLSVVRPTLLNNYSRRYFLSACGRFRITIDFNQCFYPLNSFNGLENIPVKLPEDDFVMEFKYGIEHDDVAGNVAEKFPFRLSKNSKYVIGMNSIFKEEY